MPKSHDVETVTRRKKKTPTTNSSTAPNGSHSPSIGPGPEEVAKLAYQFWEERGRPHGSSDEDWFRAEGRLVGTTS